MRRRAVGEGLQQETKTFLRRLLAHPQDLENLLLEWGLMNPDAAGAELHAIEHQVIGSRPHLAPITRKQGAVFRMGRGKRVVLGIPSFGVRVPVEERETRHPAKRW